MVATCRISLVLTLVVCFGCAQPPDLTEPESAAITWLSKVDQGDFAAAWSEASSELRHKVSESDWIENLRAIRKPLGKIEHRSLDSLELLDSLPEVADGKFAMLYFSSAFENNAQTSEVIVLFQEQDGSWRTLGYYKD